MTPLNIVARTQPNTTLAKSDDVFNDPTFCLNHQNTREKKTLTHVANCFQLKVAKTTAKCC